MKIPSKVRIKRGVSYDVVFQETMGEDYKGRKILGDCNPINRQIRISMDQSETSISQTYIHELLHAIESEWDIEIKHNEIHKLEHAIYRLLVLNKLI